VAGTDGSRHVGFHHFCPWWDSAPFPWPPIILYTDLVCVPLAALSRLLPGTEEWVPRTCWELAHLQGHVQSSSGICQSQTVFWSPVPSQPLLASRLGHSLGLGQAGRRMVPARPSPHAFAHRLGVNLGQEPPPTSGNSGLRSQMYPGDVGSLTSESHHLKDLGRRTVGESGSADVPGVLDSSAGFLWGRGGARALGLHFIGP
jgi:hypothetical protein